MIFQTERCRLYRSKIWKVDYRSEFLPFSCNQSRLLAFWQGKSGWVGQWHAIMKSNLAAKSRQRRGLMLRETPSFQWMNKSSRQLTSFLFLKQTLFSILYSICPQTTTRLEGECHHQVNILYNDNTLYYCFTPKTFHVFFLLLTETSWRKSVNTTQT